MNRTERHAAAELRRKAWRLRWLDLAQSRNQGGTPIRECIAAVAVDAATLSTQNPQLKSEIMRALDEFVDAVCKSIIRLRSTP